jgi:hypothetical protein
VQHQATTIPVQAPETIVAIAVTAISTEAVTAISAAGVTVAGVPLESTTSSTPPALGMRVFVTATASATVTAEASRPSADAAASVPAAETTMTGQAVTVAVC